MTAVSAVNGVGTGKKPFEKERVIDEETKRINEPLFDFKERKRQAETTGSLAMEPSVLNTNTSVAGVGLNLVA